MSSDGIAFNASVEESEMWAAGVCLNVSLASLPTYPNVN